MGTGAVLGARRQDRHPASSTARAETVHNKPSFGAAFRSRRCLVPADGWFEWQATLARQAALLPGSRGRSAAVVRRFVGALGTRAATPSSPFTIITTAASPGLADVHHRQPAIIDPDGFDAWLDPSSPVPRLLDLVREPHDGPYEKRAVSTRVNSIRNDDPDVLAPKPGAIGNVPDQGCLL